LRTLLGISEEDCRLPAKWAGTDRSVNFLLRHLSSHQLDHLQHLQKLLRGRQRALTESQILLMKAHALQGELEAILLSLTDEEFTQDGPNEGDWSAQQLAEHLAQIERGYRQEIRSSIEKAHADTARVAS
jgi:hypothetical protein